MHEIFELTSLLYQQLRKKFGSKRNLRDHLRACLSPCGFLLTLTPTLKDCSIPADSPEKEGIEPPPCHKFSPTPQERCALRTLMRPCPQGDIPRTRHIPPHRSRPKTRLRGLTLTTCAPQAAEIWFGENCWCSKEWLDIGACLRYRIQEKDSLLSKHSAQQSETANEQQAALPRE